MKLSRTQRRSIRKYRDYIRKQVLLLPALPTRMISLRHLDPDGPQAAYDAYDHIGRTLDKHFGVDAGAIPHRPREGEGARQAEREGGGIEGQAVKARSATSSLPGRSPAQNLLDQMCAMELSDEDALRLVHMVVIRNRQPPTWVQ